MFSLKRISLCAAALATTWGVGAATAAEHAFPSKPVTIIVPYPAGGGTNALARQIGAELQKTWGQSVVVDNRVGASGNIGSRYVAESPADGHMLLFVNSTYAINPGVFRNLPFDPKADLMPVINVAFVPSVFIVPSASQYRSLKDVLAASKPGQAGVPYGSCGNGTPQHLAGEQMNLVAKVQLQHIPYKGCGPAVIDVLGNQVPLALVAASSAMPHVASGKLRALAVTSKARSPFMPDVPTVGETLPGYELDQWHGFLAPAKTPKAVIDKLNADIAAVVKRDDFQKKMKEAVFAPTTSSPAGFKTLVSDDIDRFTKLSQQIGLKID